MYNPKIGKKYSLVKKNPQAHLFLLEYKSIKTYTAIKYRCFICTIIVQVIFIIRFFIC